MNNELSITGKTPEIWLQVLEQHANATLRSQGRSYIVLTSENHLAAVDQIPQGAQKLEFKTVTTTISKLINSKQIDPTVKESLNLQLVSLAQYTISHHREMTKENLDLARQILELNQVPQSSGAESATSIVVPNKSYQPSISSNSGAESAKSIVVPNKSYQPSTSSNSGATSSTSTVVPNNSYRPLASSSSGAASSTSIDVPNKIYRKNILPNTALISSDLRTTLLTILSSPKLTITRSRTGKDGTYFCTVSNQRVPLKFVIQPQRHIIADRFFQTMGYTTPNTKLVPAGVVSDETKAKILASAPSNQSNVSRPLVQMDYLTALAWGDAKAWEKQEALKNSEFGIQIGKMLILDILIGNTDRLAKGAFNAGNFMIDLGKDAENGILVLCDSEIRLDDVEIAQSRSNELRELLDDPKTLKEYLYDSGFLRSENATFEERVKQGILKGIDEFLQLCDDTEKLDIIFDKTGLPEDFTTFNYLDAINEVKKVLKTLIGDGHDADSARE